MPALYTPPLIHFVALCCPPSAEPAAATAAPATAGAGAAGFTVKPVVKAAESKAEQAQRVREVEQASDRAEEGVEEEEGSDWETASEEEMQTDEKVGYRKFDCILLQAILFCTDEQVLAWEVEMQTEEKVGPVLYLDQ